ncbi:hypothetical protein GCM10009836_44520 [Pseudonocardia ailaonensis]|uniref:Rieske domain-containing protein n=1 Tax=Pseudonocardia ailaonensis TaxID=367279 RepID=A0ABN2NA05_9PSEU
MFPAAELAVGTMRGASVGKISVVVIRDGAGNLTALRDVCPHHYARLSDGRLEQMVVGDEVGEKELSDTYIVRCPRHGHEFDVATGLCPADASHRVRPFAVSIENDMVVVEW